MPVIAGRIVDQRLDAAEVFDDGGDRCLRRFDIEEVDLGKDRGVRNPKRLATGDRLGGFVDLHVKKRDPAALFGELFDERGTNTVGTAGDQYRPIYERRVGRILGVGSCFWVDWHGGCSPRGKSVDVRARSRRATQGW